MKRDLSVACLYQLSEERCSKRRPRRKVQLGKHVDIVVYRTHHSSVSNDETVRRVGAFNPTFPWPFAAGKLAANDAFVSLFYSRYAIARYVLLHLCCHAALDEVFPKGLYEHL